MSFIPPCCQVNPPKVHVSLPEGRDSSHVETTIKWHLFSIFWQSNPAFICGKEFGGLRQNKKVFEEGKFGPVAYNPKAHITEIYVIEQSKLWGIHIWVLRHTYPKFWGTYIQDFWSTWTRSQWHISNYACGGFVASSMWLLGQNKGWNSSFCCGQIFGIVWTVLWTLQWTELWHLVDRSVADFMRIVAWSRADLALRSLVCFDLDFSCWWRSCKKRIVGFFPCGVLP